MSAECVLVTGGAGFIGSHLAEALLREQKRVILLDDLSTGRLSNIESLLEREDVTFVQGDVCDEITVAPLVAKSDAVVHLAAAVGVELILREPVRTMQTNIYGTETVLRTAAEKGCRVLLASTSEVYGKSAKTPFAEEDDVTLGPTSRNRWSYACSKMIDEFLGLAWHDRMKLEVVICRFFNTIGPRQRGQYGMVVPRFVHHALLGEPLDVYGDGQQSRCFCNVADVTAALIKLLDEPAAPGEVLNIGTDESVTILELAKKIIALTGSTSGIRMVDYDQAYGPGFDDMRQREPDLSKIRKLIGYQPKYTLQQTLEQIIVDQQNVIRAKG